MTLQLGSISLHTFYLQVLFIWNMSQIGLSREYSIYALKRISLRGLIRPWPLTYIYHLRSLHNLWKNTLLVKRDYSYTSLTVTLHLETWFNVTAHSLPKGTLWVKYTPDWVKVWEDVKRTWDLVRTEGRKIGWTDWQTDIFSCPQSMHPHFVNSFQHI